MKDEFRRRLMRAANRKMLAFENNGQVRRRDLQPEDWYLGNALPLEAGNRSGYWVPVMLFVRKPRKPRRKR